METISDLMALSIGVGFLVTLLTGLHDGKSKAHHNWRGSVCAGLVLSSTYPEGVYGFAAIIVGGVFGLVGWLAFRQMFPLTEE